MNSVAKRIRVLQDLKISSSLGSEKVHYETGYLSLAADDSMTVAVESIHVHSGLPSEISRISRRCNQSCEAMVLEEGMGYESRSETEKGSVE